MVQALPTNPAQSAFQQGEIELKGQFMLGSNYTFLVDVHHEDKTFPAVYKPSRGEQPLWDFPDNSLAQREVAAYVVSEALGFHIVPFTVLRADGPHGPGSLQQYIEYDPKYHYFNFSEEDKQCLKPVALFDLLCNNADRKGSHVFFEKDTHKLYAIDHGICFHEQNKLRTVLWDFAGQPIPDELLAPLASTVNWPNLLEAYLSTGEISALESRAESLLRSKKFPAEPRDRRAYPYPPL
ncbi:MAG TPA: SCO1664 family protein [Anaerolineales bacterium]|jgi:uncharacterized repeat protein (TIGR03843 family)|nr:SCO1664 family protein [Anaerolineales bacterium]